VDPHAGFVDTKHAAFYLIQDLKASMDDPRMHSATWTIYRWARNGVIMRHGGTGKGQARWSIREVDQAMRAYVRDNGCPPWERPRERNLTRGQI
jgi:hypothetical protein